VALRLGHSFGVGAVNVQVIAFVHRLRWFGLIWRGFDDSGFLRLV
jgi:hypothetical protein